MRVVEKYSHLNGEEYLLVHSKPVYEELLAAIQEVDAGKLRTKVSRETRMKGNMLYNPRALNTQFREVLQEKFGWESTVYSH